MVFYLSRRTESDTILKLVELCFPLKMSWHAAIGTSHVSEVIKKLLVIPDLNMIVKRNPNLKK
jgi:hypothetical protein